MSGSLLLLLSQEVTELLKRKNPFFVSPFWRARRMQGYKKLMRPMEAHICKRKKQTQQIKRKQWAAQHRPHQLLLAWPSLCSGGHRPLP